MASRDAAGSPDSYRCVRHTHHDQLRFQALERQGPGNEAEEVSQEGLGQGTVESLVGERVGESTGETTEREKHRQGVRNKAMRGGILVES